MNRNKTKKSPAKRKFPKEKKKLKPGEILIRVVGIRQLSSETSKIIKQVQTSRKPVTITKQDQPIAEITPLSKNDLEFLEDELIAEKAQKSLQTLKLHDLEFDSEIAVQSILADRD